MRPAFRGYNVTSVPDRRPLARRPAAAHARIPPQQPGTRPVPGRRVPGLRRLHRALRHHHAGACRAGGGRDGRLGLGQDHPAARGHRPDRRAARHRCAAFGQDVAGATPDGLRALRKRMGVLFQQGALFTDLNVYENVAFPLREHTGLRRGRHPRARARQAATPWACDRGPPQYFRDLRRHGPPRGAGRAVVLEAELILYDEPFAGLDPISHGHHGPADPRPVRPPGLRLGADHPRRGQSPSPSPTRSTWWVGAGLAASGPAADPVEFARPLCAPVPRRRARRPGGLPLPRHAGLRRLAGAAAGQPEPRGAQGMKTKSDQRPGRLGTRHRRRRGLFHALLRRRAGAQRHRAAPPAPCVAAGALHRQLFAAHHRRLGHVRGFRAGPAGLLRAQPLRLGRGPGPVGGACRWCASWGRW